MRYPKEAQDKNIEGRVSIQFIIEKDGSIDEVKTLRSPSEILSAEAERVVKGMPKWKPAMHKGKPVRMRYVLPVLFKLPTKEQVATVAVDEVKGN
jgi:TonB family protein